MEDQENEGQTPSNGSAENPDVDASTEQENTQETELNTDAEDSSNQSNTEEETQTEANASPDLMIQLTEAKDKYLRIYAEFENYRRRTNKEKQEIIKNASESLIKDLLPVIDDFERALKSMNEANGNEAQNKEVKAVAEGIQLIFNKFFKILQDKGLRPTESAIGKPFDLEEHESIAQIPAPKDELKGKVIDEIEKGYYLHDKVLRFTKVVIGS